MNEDFLHYVWKYRLFDQSNLKTTSDEPVEILFPGEHNLHSGPDFFNARVMVNGILWSGNVEIHLSSSDWIKHGHSGDQAYSNVVLHVVMENDFPVRDTRKNEIPCIELKYRIFPYVQHNNTLLNQSALVIPCARSHGELNELIIRSWLERMAVERLEAKTEKLKERLIRNNGNWEETLYQLLAANFGFKVNTQPFHQLAASVPSTLAARHRNNLMQLEALYFGQAGFLDGEMSDKYSISLQNEYTFLKHKYSLACMRKEYWMFMRLRPLNFPTIRIAQFAMLMHKSEFMFSKILEAEKSDEYSLILTTGTSEYWNTHYAFGKTSVSKEKKLASGAISILLINTVVPLLFLYGRERNEEQFCDKAVRLLESLEMETNSKIKKVAGLVKDKGNAAVSQALIHLHDNYCLTKQCLRCGIGNAVLSKNVKS